MRVHLDLVGGLAGDMFVAAVMEAKPELAEGLLKTLRTLSLPAGVCAALVDTRAGGLKGLRFDVSMPDDGHHEHAHRHHRSYRNIREWLSASPLNEPVKEHALALFGVLADAEAGVHGIDVESVEFHEVGAWDSVVDFVAAAWIIDAMGACRWTWSPIPLGWGLVRCAHGLLPVPAPATARLLTGLQVKDDGIGGERVTPTGAAILRYLSDSGVASRAPAHVHEVLVGTGTGHGTRSMPGIANIVRCILFDETEQVPTGYGEIASLQFEVDDQSPEDLAAAIDHIRASAGVLEVYQAPLFGKKGRVAVQVQILLEVSAIETVSAACFAETTTLGLRISRVMRRTLARRDVTLDGEPALRVKLARRPSGEITAKAEMDDVAHRRGHALREQARTAAQQRAINEDLHEPDRSRYRGDK
jgi:uncharacterized protein (TIGR00299 family) protein